MATRKRESAPFQPILGEQSVATAVAKGNVQQGVEEKALAGLLSTTGKMATDAHQGYREAALEIDLENTIDSYYDEQGNSIALQDANRDLADSSASLESVERGGERGSPEEDPIDPDETRALENAKREVTRLTNAQQNGNLSALDLKIRLERITKEHINRMPGMATPLRNIFKGVLGDRQYRFAMVDSIEKQQAAAARKSGAMKEWYLKEFAKKGINVDELGFEAAQLQYLAEMRDAQLTLQTENFAKRDKASNLTILEDDISRGAHEREEDRKLASKLYRILGTEGTKDESGNPITAEMQNAQFEEAFRESVRSFEERYSQNTDHPLYKSMVEGLEAKKKAALGVLRMDITPTQKENAIRTIMATSKLVALKAPGVAEALTLINLDPSSPLTQGSGAKVMKLAAQAFARQAIGINIKEDGTAYIDSENAEMVKFATAGMKALGKDLSGANILHVSDMLGHLEAVLDSPTWGDVNTRGVKTNDALLDMTNDPDFFKLLTRIADPAGGPAMGVSAKDVAAANSVIELLDKRTKTYINHSVKPKFFNEFDVNNMVLTTSPSGNVQVTAIPSAPDSVKKAARTLNRKYLNRLEKYVRAQVALGNDEVVGDFRKNFYKAIETITLSKKRMEADELAAARTDAGKIDATATRRKSTEEQKKVLEAGLFYMKEPYRDERGMEIVELGWPSLFDVIAGEDVNDWDALKEFVADALNLLPQTHIAAALATLPEKFMQGWNNVDEKGNSKWWNPKDPKLAAEEKERNKDNAEAAKLVGFEGANKQLGADNNVATPRHIKFKDLVPGSNVGE